MAAATMEKENPTLSSSSTTSSFTCEWNYDVFISFRGADTRSGFTGYLYNTLYSKGINTFIDDRELGKGEEITPALDKAIQESRIALVIFSKNYASSTFCLEELTKIMECSKDKGMLVVPVFYQVDPSEVRHQIGSYAVALAKHESRTEKEKIDKWRLALKKAADLSGSHTKPDTDRYEYEFIGNIVQDISKKINRTPLHVANYPVRLESQVQKIKSLLNVESNKGTSMVGIYGTDGIGKTTLARAVYNSLAYKFERLCLLDDIRENSMMHGGLVQLQERLLYELVGEKDIKLWSVNKGIPIIKSRLSGKKILLILDDVDKLDQLNALAGGLDWFGSGSRIIITTRHKHLLDVFGVETTYEVEPLNHKEARELFSWNAFKRKEVNPIYLNIADRVIHYSKGLPLSLEKISFDLFGKTVWECNSLLDIQKIPYLHDSDMDLSQHHGVRLNKKLDKEQTRKEKAEAHLYTIIKVALDADLYEQIGKDLYFDLVDHDKVRRFRIPKQTPFTLFKEEVAREFGIPVIYQRFWFWAKRQNQSYRPNRPLMPQEETQSVGQLAEQVSNKANNAELKLFLELEIGQDFGLIPPPEKSKEDLLLFFKLYDPLHEKLCYIGRFYVPASGKPMDILTRLKEMAGFSLDEEIELFKEIKFDPRDMCERVGKDFPFRASELEDGDIICYQKACEVGNGVPFRYRDVPSFLKYAYNHKTSHKYHEVLDLTTLKIAFHHATEDDVVIHTIRLPKKSVVVDVINDLKSKVDLSHPAAELRLLRISDHKIMKIFSIREKIEDITKYGTIRAEEIPEEEKNLGTDDKLIHVYHFKTYIEQNQQHIQNFGHPFFLVIHKHEELVHIKLRIQKKFRVPYDEILKWKFASVRFHRSKYLHKSVYDEFKKGSTYGDWEQYLGLEHGD